MRLLLLLLQCASIVGFTKVIVPSVYKEWDNGKTPDWMTNTQLRQKYNYTTFLYQKTNASAPNYISTNRGTEAGVYLRYIVDHYDSFPDVAVFVHAHPHEHLHNWLELVGCISPNATFMNFNEGFLCRATWWWTHTQVWVEQCWRDVLRITWGFDNDTQKLNEWLPIGSPIEVCFTPSQQFILSRDQMRRRPLSVWKKLLYIIGEQSVCHEGPPDYNNLYASTKWPVLNGPNHVGPETPNIAAEGENEQNPGYGVTTQGGAMEHLAHVVFGLQRLEMSPPTNEDYCRNYLPKCPHSLCKG